MRKKLRILMINDKGYKSGGMQVYNFELAEQLRKRGHEVKILSSTVNNELGTLSDFYFKHFNDKNISSRIFYSLFYPKSYSYLKKVLKEYKPDLVHLNNILIQSSPSILLPLKEFPTILTLHGSSFNCPKNRIDNNSEFCYKDFGGLGCLFCLKAHYPHQKLRLFLFKHFFKNVNRFVAVSNYIRNDFIRHNYCGKKKIVTIHNRIKLINFSPLPKKTSLLYLGRLSEEKGLDYLINAMQKIIEHNRNIKLYIVGSGDIEESLRKLVEKLKLEENIVFSGEISYNKINKYYENSSIVFIPSICSDSYPTVTMEAMSAGRPVIASRLGGLPEQIEDGKTGFLVKPKDSEAIAEKVIYLLKNPELMNKMSLESRKKAENEFDICDYPKEIEKVYYQAIKENKIKYNNKKGD